MSAQELIERAAELRLAGIVVTDHHYQWPQAELQAIAERTGHPDLVVLSAYELTSSEPRTRQHAGDLLIYGSPDDATMPMWTCYEDAITIARAHDALIISAHPFRQNAGAGDRVYHMDIDGLEIYNQNHSPLDVMRARTAARKTGLIAVGGSDAHRVAQVAQFLTVFRRPVKTMEDFVREIRARRFALQSNRPDIS